ncbi:unnamed protein product [Ectocarpus fasciculatus]
MSDPNCTDNTIVIVGGGLSGLVTARELSKTLDAPSDAGLNATKIVVLEARDRFGGRILREHGVDLGATWTWPSNDTALLKVATECKVPLEEQYVEGSALLQHSNGRAAHYGRNESPAGGGSMRFRGGPSAIIDKLVDELSADSRVELQLNTAVRSVSTSVDGTLDCTISTCNPSTGTQGLPVQAKAVVIALPLQLVAKSISFEPPLPPKQSTLMARTPTWMGNTGKIGFLYKNHFWKELGYSGTVFSEVGPMAQIWDSCSADNETAALSSFVFDEALHSLKDPEHALSQDSPVMRQLVQVFGPQAKTPTKIVWKAWHTDPFTSHHSGDSSVEGDTPLGHPIAHKAHHNIIFSGAESCPYENGHMNGAVVAALRAQKEVISLIRRRL